MSLEEVIFELRNMSCSNSSRVPDHFLFSALNDDVTLDELRSDETSDDLKCALVEYFVESWPTNFNGTQEFLFDSHSHTKNQLIVYSVLIVISLICNGYGLRGLLKKIKSIQNTCRLFIHLTIADLMVTLFTIPMEMSWRVFPSWMAGNFMCKFLQMLRLFGPYASSTIIACLAVDRLNAVAKPLMFRFGHEKNKRMLLFAWAFSFVASAPQLFMYHVQSHPVVEDFHQCISFEVNPRELSNKLYMMYTLIILYFLPLTVIITCYAKIIHIMSNKLRQYTDENISESYVHFKRRGSSLEALHAEPTVTVTLASAKTRFKSLRRKTARMVILIVVSFFLAWLPHVVNIILFIYDLGAASVFDDILKSASVALPVLNNCVNPFIYSLPAVQKYMSCFYKRRDSL